MPVPVLMYHAIGEQATASQAYDDADFTVRLDSFNAHLKYLGEQGIQSVLLDEISTEGVSPASQSTILITFDDGHKSDANVAMPLLHDAGMKAEFFITTDWIGTGDYMSPAEIRLLSDSGMGVGSHGASHRFFNDMSYSQARDELHRSKSILEDIIGKEVTAFSAPGGQLPKRLPELIEECGYRYVCTSSVSLLNDKNFPLAVPRVAMRRDLSLDDFHSIVTCEKRFYRRVQWRAAVLGAIRQSIGNDNYMNIRERMARRQRA